MKRQLFILLLLLSVHVSAQMQHKAPMVGIVVGEGVYDIQPVQTQTEVKPGWKIVDYQTKSKAIRYLWGKTSRQLCETRRPIFVVRPENGGIGDIIVVKLKQKSEYRRLQKANFLECAPVFVDLGTFKIELQKDESYRITPHEDMAPGEYIILNMADQPVNEMGDRTTYPFTIPKIEN